MESNIGILLQPDKNIVKEQPVGGEKAQEPGPSEEDLLLAELDKKLEEKEAQVEKRAPLTPEPIQQSAIPEAPAATTG
ncbi:MAG: hypothetical protein QXG38_03135, partial [Candidatus Hadarchaeales archaeon]